MSKGLLVDKVGINCTDAADVVAITVGGQQVASADRRFLFKMGNTFYKLTTDSSGVASPVAVDTQAITVDSVLAEGNTADELSNVSSCPSFGGEVVFPIIAMKGKYGDVQPTASLSFGKKTTADVYVYNDYSAEYNLSDGSLAATIISILVDKTLTGNATLEVYGSIYKNGSWSEWISAKNLEGQSAEKIKFRSVYRIREFNGSDSATVNSIVLVYGSNNAPVTGNEADIISITKDFHTDLGFASLVVKHKKMTDSVMEAFVSLRDKVKTRESIDIGVGNGSTQTFILGLAGLEGQPHIPDAGIDHNSLSIKVDGNNLQDFEFNMETSQVTLYADQGARVTASYNYNWTSEEWRKMTEVVSQPYQSSDDTMATKFELLISDTGKQITNVRLKLTRNSGTVENELVGVATGKPQTIILPHFARKDTLVCSAESFSYDDETRELSCIDTKGNDIIVSYDWSGTTQEIYAIAPSWAAANDTSIGGGGSDESGVDSIDIIRIKTQLLYTQALLTELSEQLENLENNG